MNRLAKETSPYLLQHAHNPVDWFPWGDEALSVAKKENRPVLVSIGYAACHWCHVMERESFEDAATAAFMNAHFVNIKIDREERPDLDAIYMDAVQLIAGNGGWPLNVFLTPDAKPFYGGTYFPPQRAFNRSSWMEVLQAIAAAWKNQPDEIAEQAESLIKHIQSGNFLQQLNAESTVFSQDTLHQTAENLLKNADMHWGGFGSAPKFPQTFSITYLLRHYYFSKAKNEVYQEVAEKGLGAALLSLDKMILGGIYDQVGGGFARYATDTYWQIPHFEKMLYDNALLIITLSEAYQLTGKPLYKKVIQQTLDFVEREWIAPDGGFYAAYDADSEGVEGKYYTWSKTEIETLLGNDAPLFCDYYQVTEEGNWEETNILWSTQLLEDYCKDEKLDFNETEKKLNTAKALLLAERNKRIKPLLDDKILMNWNALMITAYCKAYMALGTPSYRAIAENAAAFIEAKLCVDGKYYHNYKSRATIPAFLDDLSFYVQALIFLQEITANQQYLLTAQQCTTYILENFSDVDEPLLYYTAVNQADIVVRKKEWYDGATPSGNSVMAFCLNYLGILFNMPAWRVQSEKIIEHFANGIRKYPTSFGNAALALQQFVNGTEEVSVNGKNSKEALEKILKFYWPNKIIQTQLIPDNQFPLFTNRWPDNESVRLYLCKNNMCNQPVNDIESLMQQRQQYTALSSD